ncbi:hypothetical protein F4776DRAFT_607362 [Hypoxylon sp. NC0597]|nr:hypothetical protein F4776DRAFT_607362 [Hypoxylon sp. NC0597]
MYSNMGHSLTTPFFSYYFPRFGRLYGEGCDGLEAEDTLGGSSRIDLTCRLALRLLCFVLLFFFFFITLPFYLLLKCVERG